MRRRRLVRVPASSANLGPGFDVLSAALALHTEIEVTETGTFAVETDLEIARDRRNLVVRGFERLHPPDDFTFRITSDIPLTGGLGTSAAAYMAGLMAADHMFELGADLFSLCTEMEGHPDNAAAALYGGITISADGEATRFDPPAGLEAVLVVPHEPVRTHHARSVLPDEVPIAEATGNVAHAALLVLGLATGDWDLVARGLKDGLHQDRRAHLFPHSAALLEKTPAMGALGATISGAGPTVLVWCHYEQTGGVTEALRRETDGWAQVLRAPFEPQGADVRAL
jgi:homoserine kinase